MCDCIGNTYYTGSICGKFKFSKIYYNIKVSLLCLAQTLTWNAFCTNTYMCDRLKGLSCQSNRCQCTTFSTYSFSWNGTLCA
jgi:hypothetical protein